MFLIPVKLIENVSTRLASLLYSSPINFFLLFLFKTVCLCAFSLRNEAMCLRTWSTIVTKFARENWLAQGVIIKQAIVSLQEK